MFSTCNKALTTSLVMNFLFMTSIKVEAIYQYGGSGISPYGSMKSRVQEARSAYWGAQKNDKNQIISISSASRELTSGINEGYLVAEQFSSSACTAGTLEYSAVYKLGSCVSSTGGSYMYSDYVEVGESFQVTYTSYDETDCFGVGVSKNILYSTFCSDGVIYSLSASSSDLPTGVVIA